MFVVFDKNGLTEWWDFDKSQTDGRKYYPAPTNISPGTQCKLVDGEIVSMTQSEIDEFLKKEQKKFFIKKHILFVNKICESNILKKYSRDDQRNIDRDALPLKALQTVDPSRLKDKEQKLLATHTQMSIDINKELLICRKIKQKLRTLSFEELKVFNVIQEVALQRAQQDKNYAS